MSSPANRTALREEENLSAPASQQVIASAVTGPTPYSRAASVFAPVRCPGGIQQPVPQLFQVPFQAGEHVQGGGDLQACHGRRQVRRAAARTAAMPCPVRSAPGDSCGAPLVEEDRAER